LNQESPPFAGFTKDTFNFLSELEENNNTAWFNSNKSRYDNNIVYPSKLFVTAIAPFFNQLNNKIRTEPKFNYTLVKINKDMRFYKESPYRNYFLVHFGRFKFDSEFYIYIEKSGITYGLFLNNTVGNNFYFIKNLPGYKDELINTFKQFELNDKFSFFEMEREPRLLIEQFNIERDFPTFARTKHILLEKAMPKEDETLYSGDFLNEVIKTFSSLYPVYCYSISHNPLSLIEEFEEKMGVVK
jgi:hypothetical protein